jgi:hypothetical protein
VTTALPAQVITDEVLLRTSSSVEHTLIDAYTTLLGMNLGPDVADALKRFQDQHNDHAEMFEQLTKSVGGQPYTKANPVVKTNVIDPVMAEAKADGNKPEDLVIIAHALENLAAGTFQQFVPILTVPALRSSIMSVGGVEARHAAVLAKLINGAKVVTIPSDLSPATTAAASTVAGATTTTAATNAASTYQVPGAFGSLAPVALTLMGQSTPIDLLGPNSYIYDQMS